MCLQIFSKLSNLCILQSPTAIVAMLNDRTAELIGQSEDHYSTVFLT